MNRLRRVSPELGLRYATRWADDSLTLLKSPPAEKIAEFVAALASWASVTRTLGDPTDASFALERALQIHRTNFGPLWSSLLHRAALTLRDLSGAEGCLDAIPLVREGAVLAQFSGNGQDLLVHLTAMAWLAHDAGDLRTALHAAVSASPHAKVPVERVSLALVICGVHCMEGLFHEAEDTLAAIEPSDLEQVSASDRHRVDRFKAQIAVGLGDLEAAHATMCRLLDTAADELPPLLRLRLFCEYVIVLRQMERLNELPARAANFLQDLPTLRLSPRTLQIASQFLLVCRDQEITDQPEAALRLLRASTS